MKSLIHTGEVVDLAPRSRTTKVVQDGDDDVEINITKRQIFSILRRNVSRPFLVQILYVKIKSKKLKRKECVYIGDTAYDLQMCKKGKIDFLFAKYGYKIGIKNYKNKISKFSDIKKIF